MAETAETQQNRLIPPHKVLQKDLKQSADQGQHLADAFSASVHRLKDKIAKH